MTSMQAQYYTQADRTIVACPSLAEKELEALFQRQLSQQNLPSDTQLPGRGQVKFMSHQDETYVVRHYFRGGLCRHLNKDRYFYQGLKRTRPWREWHLLWNLYQQGFAVPRPIACRIHYHGLFYRGDLITLEIPDAKPLSQCLDTVNLATWQRIGDTIRQFHNAGIYHADLNAHNILIDQQQQVWLIDFDRARTRTVAENWQQANLKRLQRSLAKIQQTLKHSALSTSWQQLVRAYNQDQRE